MYQAQLARFGWQRSARVPCMGRDHDLPCAGHSWFQLELTLVETAHCAPKLLLRQWWDSSSHSARRNEGDAETIRRKTQGETEEQEAMWLKHGRNAETCLEAQWGITHGAGDAWRELLLGEWLEAVGRRSLIPKEVCLWGTAIMGNPNQGRDIPERVQPMDDLCQGRGKWERNQA